MTAGSSSSPVFDFTSLDYSSVVSDLETFAQQQFPDELWTDFNSSNFATYLIELLGYATDLLAYNVNASVLETTPYTLVREQNFRNIAKSLDYSMYSASASSSSQMRVYGLSDNPLLYPLTIDSRLQFTTEDGTVFQPQAAYSFSFASTSTDMSDGRYVTIAVVQGEEHADTLSGISGSTGQPGQRYALGSTPLIDGTLTVYVGADEYTLVSNEVESGPSDKTYTIETDENLITYVTFGDNINGVIPPLGAAITASYKTGGGESTNYASGTVLECTGGLVTIPLAISSGNPGARLITEASGGGPRQTLVGAKRALPAAIKANARAVTDDDYATYAEEVSGVFRAKGKAGSPISGLVPLFLFVVPNGSGVRYASSVLINQILVYLADYRMSGKRVIVKNPSYVNFLIDVSLFCLKSASKLATEQRLRDTLLALFAESNVDFGATFSLQALYELTGSSYVSGVSRVLYNKFTIEPHSGTYVNKPPTGTGSVIGISPDWTKVKRREWMIRVMSSNPPGGVYCSRFLVRQRCLGTASSVVDTVLTDSSAAYTDSEFLSGSWYLHPRPEELDDSYRWLVTGNTEQTITASSASLLLYAQPYDPYVVEKDESAYGKILRTYTSGAVTASTMVPVVSEESFEVGDTVLVQDVSPSTIEYRQEISSIIPLTEVLLDGDMELNNVTSWTAVNTATLSKNTAAPHTGTRNLRIAFGGTLNPYARQSIMVSGRRYRITGYGKSDGTSPPKVVHNGSAIWTGTTDVAWQSFDLTITAAATSVDFGFTGGAGYVEFDDCSVEQQPALVLDAAITTSSGSSVAFVWESGDGSIAFSVVEGSTDFILGDEIYVDTYPAVGDISIRSEDFPQIDTGNITVTSIGGV